MNKEKLLSSLSSRPRAIDEPTISNTTQQSYSGLELSDVIYKELSFFKKNDVNALFRDMKSDDYFLKIKKDISETGCILNPLIAMPSGLLIEGETRLLIAEQLLSEGNSAFERIPVRLILSPLNDTEQKKRLILGNLSRFEIDENTRLLLYSEIWPSYFSPDSKKGRPRNTDTVSGLSPDLNEITSSEGMSERQLQREKKIYLNASTIARTQGKNKPDIKDVQTARIQINNQRKKKTDKSVEGNSTDFSAKRSPTYTILDLMLNTFSEILTSIPFSVNDTGTSPFQSRINSLVDEISRISDLDSMAIERIHEYQITMNETKSNETDPITPLEDSHA